MQKRNPQRMTQPCARAEMAARRLSLGILSLVAALAFGGFLCPVSGGHAETLSYVAHGVVIAKSPGEIQVEIPGKDEIDGVVYRVSTVIPIIDEQGLLAEPGDVPLQAHVALHITDDTILRIVLLRD